MGLTELVSSPAEDLSSKSVSLPRAGETTRRCRNLHPCPLRELGGFVSFPGPFSFNRSRGTAVPLLTESLGRTSGVRGSLTSCLVGVGCPCCSLWLWVLRSSGPLEAGVRGEVPWHGLTGLQEGLLGQRRCGPLGHFTYCLIDTCSHSEGRGLLKPCSIDPLWTKYKTWSLISSKYQGYFIKAEHLFILGKNGSKKWILSVWDSWI